MDKKELKQKLLEEISGWFCESYCMFYGNEDYCRTCPIKDESCWLKPPHVEGNRATVEFNYCDNCIHFRPEEGQKSKPNNELCEFNRPLRFRCNMNDYTGQDHGFFLPGCKDFKMNNE